MCVSVCVSVCVCVCVCVWYEVISRGASHNSKVQGTNLKLKLIQSTQLTVPRIQ